MGMFKNTLLLAQQGNEKAMEKLLNRYDPLLKKCSIIQGHFDEDLYQSLILEFVRAVSAFKIQLKKWLSQFSAAATFSFRVILYLTLLWQNLIAFGGL